MISEIYRKYFQKSYTFLYPLLGMHKRKHPKPEQTYIAWSGMVAPSDYKLVCEYKKEDTEEWRTFEREFLVTHKYLDFCIPVDEDTVVYVFDLNPMSADVEAFMNGKYSKMSNAAKKLLTDYYGVHTPEWVYVESFLFPEKYFKMYAEILNIEEEILREVGELCEKHDPERENCTININNPENVNP
jgi:hypothetical protein